jgi:hypothetical protein
MQREESNEHPQKASMQIFFKLDTGVNATSERNLLPLKHSSPRDSLDGGTTRDVM